MAIYVKRCIVRVLFRYNLHVRFASYCSNIAILCNPHPPLAATAPGCIKNMIIRSIPFAFCPFFGAHSFVFVAVNVSHEKGIQTTSQGSVELCCELITGAGRGR